jgi:hypothetical protein
MKKIFSAAACVFCLFLGIYIGSYRVIPVYDIQKIPDISPQVSLVRIQKITGGVLSGEVEGKARILSQGNISVPDNEGTFSIDIKDLLLENTQANNEIPAGTTHVASAKGKKFYRVGTPAAERIAPENRVFFFSEFEAMSKGYRR